MSGAGRRLHQADHLRVIDLLDLVLVEEVADRGAVARQGEALLVERKLLGDRPGVVDRHQGLGVGPGAVDLAALGRRHVGLGLVRTGDQIGQLGLQRGRVSDLGPVLDGFGMEAHGGPLYV